MRRLSLTSSPLQCAGRAPAAALSLLLGACGARPAPPPPTERPAALAPAAPTAPTGQDETADLWALANGALDRQAWAAAHATYSRILRLEPDRADALMNRAITGLWLLRYDDARADIEAALALAPENAVIRRNAAIALVWLGIDARAAELIPTNDTAGDTSLLRAALAIRAGDPDAAISALDQAETAPADPWRADMLRGVALAARGDHAEALTWLQRAEAAAPLATAPVRNRAGVLLATGRTEEAHEALRRYLELAGPDAPDRAVVEALLNP